MAQVEVYKLRNTVHPEIRERSVFDLMEKGVNPDPAHYVKEWAGQMHGTLPLTIPGRLMLDPPEGYKGGELKNGDIAIVEGQPFYLDRLTGYKFVELDSFDADSVRPAQHFQYGWSVDVKGAEAISDDLAYICGDIGVPMGYLGEQSAGGIFNDRRPFLPGASDEGHLKFLHPQFMKGEEARAFIELLTELSETEQWPTISVYLYERSPITTQDLQDVREQYAPELLLPEVLRPLSKVIPVDADKSELSYLAAKVGSMDDEERRVFDAVIEAGWHCGSAAELIDLTENLGCFELQAAFTMEQYGERLLHVVREEHLGMIRSLEQSGDPEQCAFAEYVDDLRRYVDAGAYGRAVVDREGGVFTQHGYLTEKEGFQDIYRGPEDISAEHHIPASAAAAEKNDLIMVGNADLSALLLEMHVLGGDYMRDAKHNLRTLAGGGNEFILLMNDHKLVVVAAEPLFHRGTSEHEAWMAMDKTSNNHTFVMSVTDRSDGRILGSLCETTIAALNHSIRFNGISSNDPASVGQLAAFLDVFRWAVEQNRRAVPARMFIQQINEPYKAQSHAPKPAGFRVSPETARGLLAQNAVNIFKAYPEPVALLMPIDATKTSLWTTGKFEYFFKHDECERFENWARRAAGDILRQAERGEHKKTRGAEI